MLVKEAPVGQPAGGTLPYLKGTGKNCWRMGGLGGEGCKANPFLCLVPEKAGFGGFGKWGQNQETAEAGMGVVVGQGHLGLGSPRYME